MTTDREHGLPAIAAQSALRLRALVLVLGETTSPPWWRTDLLSSTGRHFCQRLFPRSAVAAAMHACGRAACGVHDHAIGARGVFHLFRLPELLEREIQHQLTGSTATLDELASLLGTHTEMLARLEQMSATSKSVHTGPKKIASVDDLSAPETYSRMASIYLSAFRSNNRVFPYAEVTT